MEPLYVRSSLLGIEEHVESVARKQATRCLQGDDAETDSTGGSLDADGDANVDVRAVNSSTESGCSYALPEMGWDYWQSSPYDVHALHGYGLWGSWLGASEAQPFVNNSHVDASGDGSEHWHSNILPMADNGMDWPNLSMPFASRVSGVPCPPPACPPLRIDNVACLCETSPPTAPPDYAPACSIPMPLPRSALPLGISECDDGSCANVLDVGPLVAAATSEHSMELPQPEALVRTRSTPDVVLAPLPCPPGLERAKSSPASVPVQSTTIERTISNDGRTAFIDWTVDARKLKVKDKVAVSPSFELAEHIPGVFRMMLHPKAVSDRKGGASFKKAKGKGSVHIKCESASAEVYDGALAIKISVHGPRKTSHTLEPLRGPILHNFADNGFCSLPKSDEEWDFSEAIDEETQNFVVSLEILDLAQV